MPSHSVRIKISSKAHTSLLQRAQENRRPASVEAALILEAALLGKPGSLKDPDEVTSEHAVSVPRISKAPMSASSEPKAVPPPGLLAKIQAAKAEIVKREQNDTEE